MHHLTFVLFALLAFALPAQDAVSLHSVTILPANQVRVVYSKNFATCAHLRSSNAACSSLGGLVHAQNVFCTSGTNVTVVLPTSAFNAGLAPGARLRMVHGNNSGVSSSCVTVTCDYSYGTACPGTNGGPILTANCCPAAGTTMSIDVTNAIPSGYGAIGFGLAQTSVPLFGCTLLLDQILVVESLQFDANGAFSLPLPLPATVSGATLNTQVYTLDGLGPAGFAATKAVFIQVL